METKTIKITKPDNVNVILGQSHFIKTAEDLYETITEAVPGIKFGLAFCEASGACLVRSEGNDSGLKKYAEENAMTLSAGHIFIILIKDAFPINILNRIKMVPEVCRIYCATANPVEVIIAETESGRACLGVVDGASPKGIETERDIQWRRNFLRKTGYKL